MQTAKMVVFGNKVKSYLRSKQVTLRDLSSFVPLDYFTLSKLLNGKYQSQEVQIHVQNIVKALANKQAINNREQAIDLLNLVDCPRFSESDWNAPPLNKLKMVSPKQPEALSSSIEEIAPAMDIGSSSVSSLEIPLSSLWNIPYLRNPFLIGRDDILKQIYERFFTNTTSTRFQALWGLGGIGKTQIALEYAYRFHQEYNAIFWVHSESRETLFSSLVTIAQILNLPEKNQQEQPIIIQAVLRWLRTHDKWLLILDSADEPEIIKELVLHNPPNSHTLLTTRVQAIRRLARPIEVRELSTDSGALLLLKRAGLLDEDTPIEQANKAEQALARIISQELGGLPLALDQAGAYIEETHCSLQAYVNLCQTHRIDLLKECGMMTGDHPEPVTRTWSLSFARIEQANPAAADLLRICSFLNSDSIPEEILMKGAIHLGPSLASDGTNLLAFNKAIAALLSYSLVRRNNTLKTISIHRLVQAVVRNSLDQQHERTWCERVLRWLSSSFPEEETLPWILSEQLLPHIEEYINFVWKSGEIWNDILPEFPFLAQRAAAYLLSRARYAEAEPLYLMAAYIWEQMLGSENFMLARAFSRLANIYMDQGKMEKAEEFYDRALLIWEKELESPDKDAFKSEIAFTLNSAANLYRRRGNFEEAALLYEHAYLLMEQVPEIEPVDKLFPLIGLAGVYWLQNKCEEAERIYLQLIDAYKQAPNIDDSDLAHVLAGLANLYQSQNRFEDAEKLYLNSLHVREKILGKEHPQIASILINLANLYYTLGKHEKAEPLYLRAIGIFEHIYGTEHLQVTSPLFGLARSYYQQNEYEKAEELFLRTLSIQEQTLGPEHPNLVLSLVLLSDLYVKQEKPAKAESIEIRYKSILEKNHQVRSDPLVNVFFV